MAALSPARRVALMLVSKRRRRNARIRELARDDRVLQELLAPDRALAFRLALGTTSAEEALGSMLDQRIRRPSSLEPRVRDALLLACFEICYLDTPAAVAASQGVELVRSVAPRAAGLANAVLRRMVTEVRPQVAAARERTQAGLAEVDDLVLVSGLPLWLVQRLLEDRGQRFASEYCLAQMDPAPVFVAANGLRYDAASLERMLEEAGLQPVVVEGMAGSFALKSARPDVLAGMLEQADLVVADVSAQMVCRLSAPREPSPLLEIGQGRGTKSILLATALGAVHPTEVCGIDSVGYKVALSARRMRHAGLGDIVSCHKLDARTLSSHNAPAWLVETYETVMVDAPCSGTGTIRRHPEIASSLTSEDVTLLASLQLEILKAASARVAPAGVLVYSTCSVLREEDEQVVQEFLASDEGRAFCVAKVDEAPACAENDVLLQMACSQQTSDGFFLSAPSLHGADGHFCARLIRRTWARGQTEYQA